MSIGAQILGRDNIFHKIGNVLGLGIPNWLDDTFGADAAEGPGLGEMAVQTSKEGVDRPIVYGICRPIGGNLIAVQDPPLILQVEQEGGGGGKGGGDDEEVMVDAPFRTYAIRICEGEITGIRRVWRNSKLVYDARGNAWGDENNGVFLSLAKFYMGSFDQLPAPELQAIFGIENVTAYRGTAYMTITQENLSELSGAVPQYIFEVERAEGYALTSRPYPLEVIEAVDLPQPELLTLRGRPSYGYVEATQLTAGLVAGELRRAIDEYTYVEAVDLTAGLAAGELRSMTDEYGYVEAIDVTAGLVAGELRLGLVRYENYPPEGVDLTAGLAGGSLT